MEQMRLALLFSVLCYTTCNTMNSKCCFANESDAREDRKQLNGAPFAKLHNSDFQFYENAIPYLKQALFPFHFIRQSYYALKEGEIRN